ncbi:MAG: Ig-like domain-containing protein [Gemmatimonadales bacterium]
MFVRTEKAEKTEKTERTTPGLSVLSVLSVLSILSSCARMEPPPGGPPDAQPPRLIATRPDTLASLGAFRGVAEFQFDEVISEGGTPSRGEGTGDLERLVILSPTTRVPEVSWRRNRITVRPREGWQPNRVYRVQLLPGVTDLRNNRSEEAAVLTFSTGAPRPRRTLQGQVVDWGTSRPAPNALVIATLLPDSLDYRAVADSSGRFNIGPLPDGEYLVTGVLDQNADHRQDSREAYGTARAPRGKSDAGEIWAFVHDTNPPRIQTIAVNDSLSATITFSQKLDPRQRLAARDVRLLLLPDSTPYPVASILPQPVDDSLHAAAVIPDTAGRADTTRAGRRAAPRLRGRADTGEVRTTRPPLFDRLVLRVPRPWPPGARLALELRGVRNVTGAAGNPVGVVAVPERAPSPKDTAAVQQPRDTAGAARPKRPPTAPANR